MLSLVIFAVVAGGTFLFYHFFKSADGTAADIEILGVEFEPAAGSVLKAQDKIIVSIRYKLTGSNRRFFVWAQILDDELGSVYEGSSPILWQKSGVIKRYVYLNGPGEVSEINVVVKNSAYEEIFNQAYPADFVYEANEELAALQDDGENSWISEVKFFPPSGSVLKAGEMVHVEIHYNINTPHGLDIWAVPVTECNMSYESSESKVSGVGKIKKYFIVSEPCHLEQLQISMANIAGKTIVCEQYEVDFTFS